MDVSTIASVATTLAQNRTDQEVGVAVLRKALDIQTDDAATLLSALPPVEPTANLPAHLGQNVNVTA